MNKEKAVYTRGAVGTTMLKTALGMLAGTLAISGYNIADTFFVGQIGKIQLAAMGFTFPVVMLAGCVFHGLGIGVVSTSAHSVGGGKMDKAARFVSSGILLVVFCSLLLGVLGFATQNWVFERFGAAAETLSEVKKYMGIWYLGCVSASLASVGNSVLISVGEAKTASAVMMGGMLLNVGLDPLFIFGLGVFPEMGIAGAALATVLSQFAAAFFVLWLLWKKHKLLRFESIPWRQLKVLWGKTVRFAVPGCIGMLMMPIGSAVITRITAEYGDAAVAATAAAGRLEAAAFIFPMALGVTLLPMVGQNYGARLYGRIKSCRIFAMRFAFVYLLVMAIIYYFTAPHLVKLFSGDAEVRGIMVSCLCIISWGFGMIEIHRYAGFFFTGCGRPAASAWLNALRILGLMIPLSLVALHFRSLTGLFAARLAADVIAGSVGWWLSRNMVEALPKDGSPNPVKRKRGKFSLRKLQVWAVDNAEIN